MSAFKPRYGNVSLIEFLIPSRRERKKKQTSKKRVHGQQYPMPLSYHKHMMVRRAAAWEGPMTFDSTQDDFLSKGPRVLI